MKRAVERALVSDRRGEVGGLEAFWREGEARGDAAPLLYLHGVPANGDEALPFLERCGGVAPDLPGFGRSAKPPGFRYSIDGYADWLEAFADARGLERFSLMVHDWGGLGLALAQRRPQSVERLVICDSVPLLPGYRWHRVARIWRTPLLGELAMGLTTERIARRILRAATTAPDDPQWRALVSSCWAHFDQGTMRAILRLYRSAPPAELGRAGERLGEVRCPALVVWGTRDPYVPPRFAHAYAEALGGEARVELVEAGHWPWIDRPELVDLVAGFLLAPAPEAH